MRTCLGLWLCTTIVLGCGGGDAGQQSGQADENAAASVDPADACTLVSRSEMETFIGPLLEPPYRVDNNRRPSPTGEGCLYRAKDYRNVTVLLDRESGEMGFRMMAGVGGQVEDLLGGRDTSANAIPANWDKVGRAFGQLIALKGPVSIQVDPLASRLDVTQQAKIISIAIGRLDDPLHYDGGAAAAKRKDIAHQAADPCSLVTRAEVEALMGKLRADPHASEDGTACVFPLDAEMFGTPVDRSLEVSWADGFYGLGQERQAMGGASKLMKASMGADIPDIGENVAGEAEPWDERITLIGGVIAIVKQDVYLKIAADGVNGFDDAKALSLLRTAVARL